MLLLDMYYTICFNQNIFVMSNSSFTPSTAKDNHVYLSLDTLYGTRYLAYPLTQW